MDSISSGPADGHLMTLDDLAKAVQRAYRMDVPGAARIRVEVSLEGLLDLSRGPGSYVRRLHLTLEES